jgi:hypothetical protein
MRIRPQDGTDVLDATEYVQDGRILFAKLIGTLLGATWLVLVGGWITVERAIVSVHVQVLEVAQTQVVRVIGVVLGGGAETIRLSWATAYRSAVEAEPVLAPLLLVFEVLVVVTVVVYVRDRVTPEVA